MPPTDTHQEVTVFLSYQTASSLDLSDDPDPESYLLSIETEILGQFIPLPHQDPVPDLPLGHLTFNLVRVGRAINDGADLHEVFDTSAETNEVAAVLYHPQQLGFRPAIEDQFSDACVADDILLLRRLEIEPFARGQRLGLAVLDQVIRDWSSGCALVTIKPFPLQFEARAKQGPDWERLALGRYPRRPKEANAHLRAYYRQLGFERLGRSEMFALCPRERQPRRQDLHLPASIRVPAQTSLDPSSP